MATADEWQLDGRTTSLQLFLAVSAKFVLRICARTAICEPPIKILVTPVIPYAFY